MITVAARDSEILSDRVRALRASLRTANSHVCAERSRLYTQAWKDSDGQPIDIRWARMLEKFLNERTIVIRDDELIVGSQTQYVIGASPDLVNDAEPAKVLKNERFSVRGETEVADVTGDQRRSILEDYDYWVGKCVQDKIFQRWHEVLGDDYERIVRSRVVVVGRGKSVSSLAVDYRHILEVGLRGIIAEAEAELARLSFTHADDMDKYHFLRAAIIILRAMINFAHRHAALARQMAETESDPTRRRELLEIAETCDRVPEHPARTFREAVQCFWFIYLGAYMDSASSVGRMDQYFYPFYKQDLEAGRITEAQAGELLACVWIKINELTQFQSEYMKELSQGELFQYVTIGGFTPDGKDATNALSFLILEVARQVKLTQPSIALTYHPTINEDLLLKGIETNRQIGGGIPAFLNGSVCMNNMVARSVPVEDARDIYFSGCVHPFAANSGMLLTCNLNSHKVFELALNSGVDPKTGKQLGLATGDPREFRTFEELLDAFKTQYSYWVDILSKLGNLAILTKKENARSPYHSALTNDCIKRGKDALVGGLRNRQWEASFNLRGLQNVANSMVAIRKLVFEEKKISMDELLDALHSNFEGREELRQQLLAMPKWGNDLDEVDTLHAELWNWTTKEADNGTLQPWLETPVMVRRGGATWHYVAGKSCGAFPDGRKSGEPMGDGNVSPVAGTDLKGPTAIINSASKLDQTTTVSNLFNMKFPPHLLKTDETKRKLLALIRTYFERGGYHLQFNMVGKETLLDAKEHPENYRDLIVRIAGFSAYFVDLVPSVQDDIIARTEHCL